MPKTLSAPFNVVLAVTSKCNYSCKHCLAGNSLDSDSDLSKEELFRLIDQLREAKVFSLCVFGGEPLCRGDIFEIIDYIHSRPFGLSMNTNATLITRDIAMRLAGYKKIKALTVSFDGDTEEVMDAMRGRGAFKNALRGIENILATKKIGVLLSVTVNRINFKRIKEMAYFGRKIGARGIRYNSVFFGGNAACNAKEIMLSPKEHREALDLVKDIHQEFGGFVSGSCLQEVEIIESLNRITPQESDSLTIHPCGAATQKCCITADGWVTPCEVMWDVKAGNIRKNSFLEIWQNSELMQSFRQPMEYSLKGHPKCIGCRYKRLCYQGHRCQPYYYSSNITPEEANCILV
ncbi:radical SAM protein [bacterium]|nr:MAG: radical SAM protein [bacterium]